MLDRLRRFLGFGHASDLESLEGREVTPEFRSLGERYGSGWRDEACLFVLSTGRAGTMSLARALALSKRIESYHEPMPTLAAVSAEAYRQGKEQWSRPEAWDRVVDAARAEYVAFAADRGRIYSESNNRLSFLAPTLARFFPASRFVFLHRNPYDVIRSGVVRGWYRRHSWDWCRIRPRPGEPFHEEWTEMSQPEQVAWLWTATNEFILDALDRLDDDRWMEARSDEMFLDGPILANRIFQFVGAPSVSASPLEEVLGQKLNASAAKVEPVSEAANAIVAPLAERLGYAL